MDKITLTLNIGHGVVGYSLHRNPILIEGPEKPLGAGMAVALVSINSIIFAWRFNESVNLDDKAMASGSRIRVRVRVKGWGQGSEGGEYFLN